MSDWSDQALARLEKQREEQRMKEEKLLEQQKIKKAFGGPLWREVRKMTMDHCRAFNVKADHNLLVLDLTDDSKLSIRSRIEGNNRRLHVSFDNEVSRLSWECGTKSGQWDVAATDDGGVRFEWGDTVATTASISEQMLDALLFD
jgi:hypothetical protein